MMYEYWWDVGGQGGSPGGVRYRAPYRDPAEVETKFCSRDIPTQPYDRDFHPSRSKTGRRVHRCMKPCSCGNFHIKARFSNSK